MLNYSNVIGFDLGCHVDGTHGWRAISHLVLNVLDDYATESQKRIMRAYDRGWTIANIPDVAMEIVDEVEDAFHEHVSSFGVTSMWMDGEWFVVTEEDALAASGW